MSNTVAATYDRLVISHPRIALLLIALAVIVFGAAANNFNLDASADSLLLDNDADLRKYLQLTKRYKTREFLFLTVTPPNDLLSPQSLGLLRELRAKLTSLPTLDSVITLLDVPLVKNVPGRLYQVAKNYRTLDSPDVNIERARQELLQSPIYRDLVVGASGETTAIQIFIKENPEYRELQRQRNELLFQRSTDKLTSQETAQLATLQKRYAELKAEADARNHSAVAAIREVIAEHADEAQLHLGGVPMIVDDMIAFIRSDLITFGGLVLAFLVVMLWLLFREWRWVAIPIVSCFVSVIIMMGLLGLAAWKVTVISSNFVALMLIITMSMNIHLLVRYRELHRDNPDADQKTLVRLTTHSMAQPCLYTVLTTITAFASLMLSEIKPVIDFGWMMGVGLLAIYVVSFVVFPALLLHTTRRPLRVPERDDFAFTQRFARFTEHHGVAVLVIAGLASSFALLGITKLEVENSFISYFKRDSEIYRGLKLIDETVGGTTPLEILLKFSDPDGDADETDDELAAMFDDTSYDASDYWFSPEKVDRIKAVHDYLEGLPEVGKVLSLASVVRIAEDLNDGKQFDAFELNVIHRRIPSILRSKLIDPYVSIEDNEVRISIRIKDSLPDLRRKALLDKIDNDLHTEIGLDRSEYELAGLLVLYNNLLQSLFKSQIQTLAVVLIAIFLMLCVLFRSPIAAAVATIPNALAALLILGIMGWLGISLDVMTITIAAITIGIAVDDCLHYLYQYKVQHPRILDDVETMHYCHANIAKAALFTTITINGGFMILVFSNFIPTILFGCLTMIAMTIALVAALTLMPKLILSWQPFKTH